MPTMTAFDQSGDWEDNIFTRQQEDGGKPYIPYVSAGDADIEPVEILDEDPMWEYYFSGDGRPEPLTEDPYEEKGFLTKEHLLPGSGIIPTSPKNKS